MQCKMRRLFSSFFLALFVLLVTAPSFTLAARSTATSFCKCICFNNSTIIALNPPPSSTSANHHALLLKRASDPDDGDSSPSKSHHKLTCADCNRAFCIDHRLPICKNAKEEDVFTTCFQRDSLKDETVVVLFLIATISLLGWALMRPWIEKLRDGSNLGNFGRGNTRSGGVLDTGSAYSRIQPGTNPATGNSRAGPSNRYSADDDSAT